MKYDLKNVKYMHYLDYKLNNTPKYMNKYDGIGFPRLVEFLYKQRHLNDQKAPDFSDAKAECKDIYRTLWREGLFRSCQA